MSQYSYYEMPYIQHNLHIVLVHCLLQCKENVGISKLVTVVFECLLYNDI
jgi:hypothetical protein